jgi:hypothetical protein
VFQLLENQMAAVIGTAMRRPANWFMIEKVGIVSGTSQIEKTFQSKVGKGFNPRPPNGEVIADRAMLLGAIQVIHEK